MKKKNMLMRGAWLLLLVFSAIFAGAPPSYGAVVDYYLQAGIYTIPVNTFNNTEAITMWGYVLCTTNWASCPAPASPPGWQPGPTLTAHAGDTLNIHLKNNLVPTALPVAPATTPFTEPTSVIIPGQVPLLGAGSFPTWTDGTTGNRTTAVQRIRSFTTETAVAGTSVYTWSSVRAGTYLYQSGTHPAVQVQMGLYGPLIVYPTGSGPGIAGQAYVPSATNTPTAYTTEVPLLYSEIDPELHYSVASSLYGVAPPAPPGVAVRGERTSTVEYKPKYFLINGLPYSPTRPAIPAGAAAGTTTLLRLLNAGLLEKTPTIFNVGYTRIIAEDGNLLPYAKLQYSSLLPAGKTLDAIFTPPVAGRIPVFDRSLNLTNNGLTATDGGGGDLVYLQVGTPSTITVTAPTATTVWRIGTLATIRWSPVTDVGPLNIYLLKGGVVVQTIKTGLVVTATSFSWLVSDTLVPGTDYSIKVTGAFTSGTSPTFTIRR